MVLHFRNTHTHTHQNQTSAWRTFAVVKVRRDKVRPIPCDLFEAHGILFSLFLSSHSSKGLDEVDRIVFAFEFNVLNLFPVHLPPSILDAMNYEEAYSNYNKNSYPHIPANSIVFRFSSFALFALAGFEKWTSKLWFTFCRTKRTGVMWNWNPHITDRVLDGNAFLRYIFDSLLFCLS